VVAEVGVSQGRCSQRILEIVAPQRLHGIDPWVHQEIPPWRARSDEDHLDVLREVPRREAFAEPLSTTLDALASQP
jgi:hypothetical protein